MKLLLLAATLPGLFWDGGPERAAALKDARIAHVFVPASKLAAWKGVAGISAQAADLQGAVKLAPPGVEYRTGVASATRTPWITSNGWRYLREGGARFYYDAPGKASALAAAEAFAYGAAAMIRTDSGGLAPLGEMLSYLGGIGGVQGEAVADIGAIDDGTAAAGEALNLLVRNNLLVRVAPASDPALKLTVRLTAEATASKVRSDLGDEKRSLRIYGSAVVIGRLTRNGAGLRVHLLNYAGAARTVPGIRVRVLGHYTKHPLELLDYTTDSEASEFTVPEFNIYQAIDLMP